VSTSADKAADCCRRLGYRSEILRSPWSRQRIFVVQREG
jgi:hypothetical protein